MSRSTRKVRRGFSAYIEAASIRYIYQHTLYLLTYGRCHYFTGQTKSHHWAYFTQLEVKDGENKGTTHYLRGMPGCFHYDGPEDIYPSKSGSPKEQLEIGEVDSSKLARIYDFLKGIEIEIVEPFGWNCQDWTLDGS